MQIDVKKITLMDSVVLDAADLFLKPLKTLENQKLFLCFRGV